jgi:hypothetical protein
MGPRLRKIVLRLPNFCETHMIVQQLGRILQAAHRREVTNQHTRLDLHLQLPPGVEDAIQSIISGMAPALKRIKTRNVRVIMSCTAVCYMERAATKLEFMSKNHPCMRKMEWCVMHTDPDNIEQVMYKVDLPL